MKKFSLLCTILLISVIAFGTNAMAATYTMRYVDQNPETGEAAQRGTLPLLKKIEEATNGEVAIETYFGETLMKAKDTWDGLKNGLADIGWMTMAYWPGKTPMSDAFGLPGLPYATPPEYAGAMWKAYEKYPEMQQEYIKGGIRPIIFFSSEPYALCTIKKPVKTLEDIKGLKIRVLGGAPTTQMKALGAVPLSIPMPDNYISLQKGVMDGAGFADEGISIWRFYEVLKYKTYAPLPVAYFTICMSEKQWKKLPAEVQEQIMSVCGYEGSQWYSEQYFSYFMTSLPETMEKNGFSMETYTLPAEERARWVEASQPAYDEYYEFTRKKGVGEPAKALVNDLANKAL